MATDYVADTTTDMPVAGVGGGQLPPSHDSASKKSHEGEHHGDHGEMVIPITRSVKVFAFCAAMNSCNIGYDVGVSTNIGRLIQDQWDLTDEEREVFVGFLNLFSIFGALGSQFVTDRYGRRQTFIVASIGLILGLLIQTAATSYAVLLTGRALVGLGTGVGLAIDPLYISEISPAKHRGELVTWSEIGINIGIVLGFLMGIILSLTVSEGMEWRAMFLLGTILPFVVIYLALRVMPETPRWYTLKDRVEEAKGVLYQIYPPGFNVDLIVADIQESLQRERLAEKTIGWHTVFCPTPGFRRMLTVGIGIAAAQQLVGIDAIQYYLLDIIASATESVPAQNAILMLLGAIKLGCIFIAGKFVDSRGRRPILFTSLIGMTASLLLISTTFYVAGKDNPNTAFTVVGLGLYLAFFSLGIGPAAWLVPSEVFATCIRAKAMSLAAMMNRIAATAMSSSFLTMRNTLSWEGFFMLLAVICMLVLVFVYFLLPETKGRSLEDMSLYFAEITGDFSVLDAERKLRVEEELRATGAGGGGSAGDDAAGPAVQAGTLT